MREWLMGAYAEYIKIPRRIVEKNMFIKPAFLSFEEASFLEPLACVIHGIEPLHIFPEDTVLIIGAGPIGLLHVFFNDKAGNVYFGIWLKMAGAKEENVKEIYARLWEKHRQKNLWSLVEESAVATLAELKKRQYKLGVISNSDGSIEKLLTDCGLAKYFDAIVDSSVFGIRKPDLKIFEFALGEIKAKPGESLFIGDSYEIDVLGAENAGLAAVNIPLILLIHLLSSSILLVCRNAAYQR